jgi:tRNA (adenine22-N1)-methyltransferase
VNKQKAPVKLSARLTAAAAMVKGGTLCDIGCDHGLLPVYMAGNGLLSRAVATDISPGSLAKATELVNKQGLDNIVETRLGDGLTPIAPGEVYTCCISGMGGMAIISIIEARLEAALSFSQLILSPNRDHMALRLFLHRSGFRIDGEEIVHERDVFYYIIDARPGTESAYDDTGYMFGQCLLKRKDQLLARFLEAELEKTQRLLSGFFDQNGGYSGPGRLAEYARQCRKALGIIATP